MSVKPRFDVFIEVAEGLGVSKDVGLVISSELPDFVLAGVETSQAPDEIKTMMLEDAKNVSGVYSPRCDPDGSNLVGHNIWVREIPNLIEMSIAFAHELVHASQIEAFTPFRYWAMDQIFTQTVGYANNPFELEAEALAQFVVIAQRNILFEKE